MRWQNANLRIVVLSVWRRAGACAGGGEWTNSIRSFYRHWDRRERNQQHNEAKLPETEFRFSFNHFICTLWSGKPKCHVIFINSLIIVVCIRMPSTFIVALSPFFAELKNTKWTFKWLKVFHGIISPWFGPHFSRSIRHDWRRWRISGCWSCGRAPWNIHECVNADTLPLRSSAFAVSQLSLGLWKMGRRKAKTTNKVTLCGASSA